MDSLFDTAFDSFWTWAVIAAALIVAFYAVPWLWRHWQQKQRPETSHNDLALEAFACQLQRQNQDLRSKLEAAIELNPQDPKAFILLGLLLSQSGDWQRAEKILRGVLTRATLPTQQRWMAQVFLLECLIRSGDYAEAQQQGDTVKRFFDSHPELQDSHHYMRLIPLLAAARAYDLARTLRSKLEKISPQDSVEMEALIYASEAEDLVDLQELDQALKLIKKAKSRGADSLLLSCLHGELARRQGLLEDARDAFLDAVLLDPGIGLAAFPILEDSHIELKHVADYENFLHHILEQRPGEPVALWALALHHWRRQHLDEALRILQEAVAENPDFGPTQRALSSLQAGRECSDTFDNQAQTAQVSTRCTHCGAEDVQALVRCPTCKHVGHIHFFVDGHLSRVAKKTRTTRDQL